jgi:hypothetical protein
VQNAPFEKRKIETTFYAAAKEKLDRRKEPVNVIVELHDDNIQGSVRTMRQDEHNENAEEYIVAFEKREYESLIRDFMSSIPLHASALVQAYFQLPMLHLRLKSSSELDTLNRDSRVKAIYENIVLKSHSRSTSLQ